MPIYEYRCKSCNHTFERMQRHSDPAPTCPSCSEEVEKLVSAPAFQFKGSGWYVTDYAGKKGDDSSSSGDGDGAKAEGGTKSDGGDAKPAKKDGGGGSSGESKPTAKAAPSGDS